VFLTMLYPTSRFDPDGLRAGGRNAEDANDDCQTLWATGCRRSQAAKKLFHPYMDSENVLGGSQFIQRLAPLVADGSYSSCELLTDMVHVSSCGNQTRI